MLWLYFNSRFSNLFGNATTSSQIEIKLINSYRWWQLLLPIGEAFTIANWDKLTTNRDNYYKSVHKHKHDQIRAAILSLRKLQFF